MNSKRFSIRLANGRQQTFESASAMVEWIDLQRSPTRRPMRRRRKLAQSTKSDRVDFNKAPLARYANQNSGEA